MLVPVKPRKTDFREKENFVEFEAAVLLGFPRNEQEILLNNKVIKTPNKMIWRIYTEIFGRYMSRDELKTLIFRKKEKYIENYNEELFSDKSYICTAYDVIHFFESKGLLYTTNAEAPTYDMAREMGYVKLNSELMFIPVANIKDEKEMKKTLEQIKEFDETITIVFEALGTLLREKLPLDVKHLRLICKDMNSFKFNNALNVLVWTRHVYLST